MVAAMKRILVAFVVVVVFAALWVIDTAALLRLTAFCVTGGCGVSPWWLVIAAVGVVGMALVLSNRPRAKGKKPKVKRSGAAKRPRGKLKAAK